jgi:hypothetical protein
MPSERTSFPSIRARWTRGLVERIGALPDPQRSSVWPRIPPTTLALVQRMNGLDWLPIEQHIEVLDALLIALGRDPYVAFYREASTALFESNLLRNIAVAGARAFGTRALLRSFPRGWNFVVRDCGGLTVERGEAGAYDVVTLSRIPGIVARSTSVHQGIAAVLWGALDLGGYTGQVVVDPGPARANTFVYHVSVQGHLRRPTLLGR